jgi:hypothetical protein
MMLFLPNGYAGTYGNIREVKYNFILSGSLDIVDYKRLWTQFAVLAFVSAVGYYTLKDPRG